MDHVLAVTLRTEFGKGASRRLRREGSVPAVVYGKDQEPVHIQVKSHDVELAVKNPTSSVMIKCGDKKFLTVAKEVQKHSFKPIIKHVDFFIVTAEEIERLEREMAEEEARIAQEQEAIMAQAAAEAAVRAAAEAEAAAAAAEAEVSAESDEEKDEPTEQG